MNNNNSMLGSYLQQQSAIVDKSAQGSETGSGSGALVVAQHQMSLDDFREYVRKYIELDTWIKKAQELLKEKKKQKDKLSEVITKFMINNDIEDLNVRNAGKIVCKVRNVKKPVSQKVIKEKITDYFNSENLGERGNQIIKKVFDERPVVEKASLRRIKIT
jgi:hypothetical protein